MRAGIVAQTATMMAEQCPTAQRSVMRSASRSRMEVRLTEARFTWTDGGGDAMKTSKTGICWGC